MAKVLLELDPELQEEVQQEGRDAGQREGQREGRLQEARCALRRVLARRGLALSAEEHARIEACADLAMLERWHDQAIEAATMAEALR